MAKIDINKFTILGLVLILAGTLFIGFGIERNEYILLWSSITASFIGYLLIVKNQKERFNFKVLLLLAILLRLLHVFYLPNLSDDYHRFLWDGELNTIGVNPYDFTPSELDSINPNIFENQEVLLEPMNSPKYNSIYPPILQSAFTVAVSITNGSVFWSIVVLKSMMVIFEIISMLLLFRILKTLKKTAIPWLLYAFNPLIIIEFTGNLHFECLMITGVLATLYLLILGNYLLGGYVFSIAVLAKLNPLMLLPLFWRKQGFNKGFLFCLICGIATILMFLPFITLDNISNFSSSLKLYFQTFEFNGSIYLIARKIGLGITGYNQIQFIGQFLSLVTFIWILSISLKDLKSEISFEELFEKLLWIFTIYCATASIVHPWYISGVILGCCLTKYRFGLLWSFLIYLSYYAYKDDTYTESTLLIFLEYSCVFGFLFWELQTKKSQKFQQQKRDDNSSLSTTI